MIGSPPNFQFLIINFKSILNDLIFKNSVIKNSLEISNFKIKIFLMSHNIYGLLSIMYLDTDTLFVTLLYKVDKISSLFKDKRVKLALIVFLLIAIPLTIFLVRQQQILKSRAAGEGSLVINGSQTSTTSQFVTLQLTYGGSAVSPTPTPTGAQTPTPTKTPTPTQTSGQPTATTVPTSTAASPTPTPTTPAGTSCSISGPDPMLLNTPSTYSVSGISCPTFGAIGTPGVCYWAAQFSSYPFIKTFDSKSSSVSITPINDGVPSGAVKLSFAKPGPYGGPVGTYCSKDITVGTTSGPGSSSCTACAADLDTSGVVDGTDTIVANYCKFAYPNFPNSSNTCSKLDFNSDNSISDSEAACVATQQGQTCAQ